MRLPVLVNGRFLRRDNRFRAVVSVDGHEAAAHVPNSGRLDDLFVPGRKVWLVPAQTEKRKTAYNIKLVEAGRVLVSVDARMPNPIFAEAVRAGQLPDFAYETIEPEVRFNESRLDFRLSGVNGVCWVETKSVTLVEAGTALFPDVPTERGSRHLRELMRLREERGVETAVVFIIQRPDAERLAPHETADPVFAVTLREAAHAGVTVRAYTCQVTRQSITVDREVPVVII
ncbi:MAG: DNA/RNA nuclease SfsA [Ardenticatenaceae bacterium]|nr:DNA/RNA nuclease SfsA [Ardenticatenaceae bacterium]